MRHAMTQAKRMQLCVDEAMRQHIGLSVRLVAHVVSLSPAREQKLRSFKTMFTWASQYFQSLCQHSIHRLVVDPATQEKNLPVPNARASKKSRQECKHGSRAGMETK